MILPLAGFTASQGDMSLLAAIVWTTGGSVAGALVLYWIGALIGGSGQAIAARLPLIKVLRHRPDRGLVPPPRPQDGVLRPHGPAVPQLRVDPGGIERMPMATFLLFTTLGSLIWNSLFVVAGYLLGENWQVIQDYAGTYQNAVLAAGSWPWWLRGGPADRGPPQHQRV